MDHEGMPEGVILHKLSPKAAAIANTILQVVKESTVVVTQLLQRTTDVPDTIMNGIISLKKLPLSEHYRAAQDLTDSVSKECALYMHNKSLIEVAGADLVHKLYRLVPTMKQDVLVNYPLLYISDNPKSSNDVLVGGTNSWSPLHQDLPLYCTSAILVLEGHKELVVVSEDAALSLRINLSSRCWDKPIRHRGRTYSDLRSLVQLTGGAVITLRAGDMMLMPPRMFHLARNCAPTVSCNFSICAMESVPLTVAQTFVRIEQCPRDVMHFDSDFARLLDDCTKAILQQAAVRASSISSTTSRKRLPRVQFILNSSVRLMEWYMTLQCIPNGWVQGFWGPVRARLLGQLCSALPLHSPGDNLAGPSAPDNDVAAVMTSARGTLAVPGSKPGSVLACVVAGSAGAARVANKSPPGASRWALSQLKIIDHNSETTQTQQEPHRGAGATREVSRRFTRPDAVAQAAEATATAAAPPPPLPPLPEGAGGSDGDATPWPRKKVKLLPRQSLAAVTGVV